MSFSPAGPEGFEPDPTGIVSREQHQQQQQQIRRVGEPAPVAAPAPVVPASVEATAPPVVEVPEQRYYWQPKDENGKPLGGKQVYVYRAASPLPVEVLEQVTKGHEMAIRALRKVNRDRELGPDPVADDAEKFTGITEFKTRELTADERFNLSQKIANPETTAEAVDLLMESAFGAKPSVLAKTLNDAQRFMVQQRAVDNYVEFVQLTPEYFDSPANRLSLTRWMGQRNWAPSVANFNRAFQHLVGQVGLLETAPEVHQVPPATPVVEAPAPAPVVAPVAPAVNSQPPAATNPGLGSEPPQTKRHSHVPSGLTPSVASVAGETPVGKTLTVADLERIPADELRRKLADPAFRKLADAAYENAEKASRARRLAQAQ